MSGDEALVTKTSGLGNISLDPDIACEDEDCRLACVSYGNSLTRLAANFGFRHVGFR